jgi:hypothetical protein
MKTMHSIFTKQFEEATDLADIVKQLNEIEEEVLKVQKENGDQSADPKKDEANKA